MRLAKGPGSSWDNQVFQSCTDLISEPHPFDVILSADRIMVDRDEPRRIAEAVCEKMYTVRMRL